MQLHKGLLPLLVISCSSVAQAASSWSFSDATVSVQGKASGATKEKLDIRAALTKPIALGSSDSLKILLTTTEDKKGKRPHQAFLQFRETGSGLEISYPFTVKESGKGKVEITQKDIPIQLLTTEGSLQASIVIGSFGSATPLDSHVFDLVVKADPAAAVKAAEKPLRYGKLEEIHHIFRADPKSPPVIITLFFTAAVLATVPILLGAWLSLGANLNHLPTALSNAPVSHMLFFGSIIGLEGIFFLYYTYWNLFQTLPAAAVVGSVAFLSGSRALTEVQERRLAGLR